MSKPFTVIILGFIVILMSSIVIAETESSFPKGANLISVDDPYVDLYIQPGRGYPITHVVERGEVIMVIKRRPNWYAIRTEQGVEGWAPAAQLAKTLQPTGMPVQLPGMSRGEFLKRSMRIGFSAGLFEGAESLAVNAGYKLLRAIDIELDAGQIFGDSLYGYMAGGNILFEPISRGRITPFASYGAGYLTFDARNKLVALDGADFIYRKAGVGANLYVGFNFVARFEHQWYFLTDNAVSGINEWKISFNTFF